VRRSQTAMRSDPLHVNGNEYTVEVIACRDVANLRTECNLFVHASNAGTARQVRLRLDRTRLDHELPLILVVSWAREMLGRALRDEFRPDQIEFL
jgi:hypothetical protein